MKKLLILGGGFLQTFAIKKAREMGYYTIVIDKNEESVGFFYANEYSIIDIVDREACLDFAIKKKVDGVLNVANDYGVLSASYIAEKLSLPGINYSTAQVVKNKSLFRKILFDNEVDDVKQYYEITSSKKLESVKTLLNYPVIVKPSDGSGSRGIMKVSNSEKLEEAYYNAKKETQINSVIIEDYIKGEEIGIESLVVDSTPYILGILDKKMTKAPYYAELGHSMPSKKLNNKKIYETIYKAIKALKIDYGAVNMDAIIDNNNNITIIDIGVRMGGNLIGSHIIPKSTGYDYLGNLIRLALNEKIHIPKDLESNVVVTRLLNLKPGKIVKLPDISQFSNTENVKVYFNKKVNEKINDYRTNLDSCGYIIYKGDNLNKANLVVDEIKNKIDNSIIRS